MHFFVRSIDERRLQDAVLFGVFMGLALLSKYYALIHGKGGMYGKAGKVRLAPLNRVSQRALGEYIQARSRILEERGVESQVLFFAVRNRYKRGVASLEPINVRSISRMLVSIALAAR